MDFLAANHVPLGVGGWPLGYEERRCLANCSRSYFPRFSTYVVMIHQRHRQTDGQTTCDRKTALCTIVHRAVKRRPIIVIMSLKYQPALF